MSDSNNSMDRPAGERVVARINVDHRKLYEQREAARKDLESRSKYLYDLVHEETFTVTDVTSGSEMKYSRADFSNPLRSRRSLAGFSHSLVLKVTSADNKIVQELIFNGTSPVMPGQVIAAKIPRYENKRPPGVDESEGPIYHLDRPYRQTEEAIEIKITNSHGSRRDRAVNYDEFVKG